MLLTDRTNAAASVALAALGIDTQLSPKGCSVQGIREQAILPPGSLTQAQVSFAQSRGWILFSAAYFVDTSATSGSMSDSSAVYQSEMIFQALPSHCCTRP